MKLPMKTSKQEEVKEETPVSIQKTEKAVALVSRMFNLNDAGYVLTGFSDGGSVKVSFANAGFEVSVKIKNPEDWGLVEELV